MSGTETPPASSKQETKVSASPTFFATITKDIAEVEDLTSRMMADSDIKEESKTREVPIFFATLTNQGTEPQRQALIDSDASNTATGTTNTDATNTDATEESEVEYGISPTESDSTPHSGSMAAPDTTNSTPTDVVDKDAIVSKIPQRPEKNPSNSNLEQAEQLRSRKTMPSLFPLDNLPTISSWVENSDDSITGIVDNSPSFESGEEIVTAPIVERTERFLNFGRKATIVTTVSGSKYRLVGPSRSVNAGDSRFKGGSPLELPPGYGFDAASEDMQAQSPSPLTSIDLRKFWDGLKIVAVEPENESEGKEISPSSPLAFFGQGAGKTFKKKKKTSDSLDGAPTGPSSRVSTKMFGKSKGTTIPSLSNWEQNKDGSITGYVANRIGFKDGTLITTSPVKTRARAGRIVTTTGGSRYKLM